MIEIRDIGQLDRRVLVKQFTETVGANGERLHTWSDYGWRWAAVEYASGKEGVMDDMALAINAVNFYLRWDGGINEKFRINYLNKEYNIRYIAEIGRMNYMMLTCETVDISEPITMDSTLDDASMTTITADMT